jgi:hypothetical protein
MKYDEQNAGMRLQISVHCQSCEVGYLNTLGRDPAGAKRYAESIGWIFYRKLGWTCPKCVEADR